MTYGIENEFAIKLSEGYVLEIMFDSYAAAGYLYTK